MLHLGQNMNSVHARRVSGYGVRLAPFFQVKCSRETKAGGSDLPCRVCRSWGVCISAQMIFLIEAAERWYVMRRAAPSPVDLFPRSAADSISSRFFCQGGPQCSQVLSFALTFRLIKKLWLTLGKNQWAPWGLQCSGSRFHRCKLLLPSFFLNSNCLLCERI